MNVYAGVPDDIRERIESAATKALEIDIREAVRILSEGQNGKLDAVIDILKAMIGENE